MHESYQPTMPPLRRVMTSKEVADRDALSAVRSRGSVFETQRANVSLTPTLTPTLPLALALAPRPHTSVPPPPPSPSPSP